MPRSTFQSCRQHKSAADCEAQHIPIMPDGCRVPGRIETEDYGTASSDYLNDPYAATPAIEEDLRLQSAPAYTKSTGEERFADYYAEWPLRFSEFRRQSSAAFIAAVIALLG